MSPSDTLASLFRQIPDKPNKFGLAVSLLDKRNSYRRKRDKTLGIKQLAGDIIRVGTWKKIENELNGRKADLIMERALGGILVFPKSEKLYEILLSKMWKMLSKNRGTLLIQTPHMETFSGENTWIDRWTEYLNQKNICAKFDQSNNYITGALMLIRTQNSPEDLPILPTPSSALGTRPSP